MTVAVFGICMQLFYYHKFQFLFNTLIYRLTSFVLRIFSQADGLIGMYIDPKVRQDAIGFIVAQQESDGSFPSVCKPTNKDMLGCGEGNCSLTAYVTLSLLEAGVSPEVASKLKCVSIHS